MGQAISYARNWGETITRFLDGVSHPARPRPLPVVATAAGCRDRYRLPRSLPVAATATATATAVVPVSAAGGCPDQAFSGHDKRIPYKHRDRRRHWPGVMIDVQRYVIPWWLLARGRPTRQDGRPGMPTRDELVAQLTGMRGNVSQLAEHYGKDAKQIYRWLKRYRLDPGAHR
jgi:hypothetical protein